MRKKKTENPDFERVHHQAHVAMAILENTRLMIQRSMWMRDEGWSESRLSSTADLYLELYEISNLIPTALHDLQKQLFSVIDNSPNFSHGFAGPDE